MSREAAALRIIARRKRILSVFIGFIAYVLRVQVLAQRKRSGPAPPRPPGESERDGEDGAIENKGVKLAILAAGVHVLWQVVQKRSIKPSACKPGRQDSRIHADE